jgi:hypothetical protein
MYSFPRVRRSESCSQRSEQPGIADKLVAGEATVRSHVSSILRKLQVASRTQAALYALREGLATLDPADVSQA